MSASECEAMETPDLLLGPQGSRVALRDEGAKDDNRPLLLIHGFGGSMGVWRPMMRFLPSGRRVLRVDLLGHGSADKPRSGYGVPAQARAVLDALRELRIDAVDAMAHSAGGDILVAMMESERSRIASATFLGTAPSLAFVAIGFSARVMRWPVIGPLLWSTVSDGMLRDGLRRTFAADFPEVPPIYVSSLRRMTYNAYVRGIRAIEAFKRQRDLCARAAGFDTPMLVVFGEGDQWVDPAAATAWARETRAAVATLTGVGHTPMAEAPEATAALALAFLSRSQPMIRAADRGGQRP